MTNTQTQLERILQRDARAVARAISAIENESPAAPALLQALFAHTGRGLVVGITGAPGAGKSSLVDKLALHYRAQEKTVGIIAVDPSSPFSGGAPQIARPAKSKAPDAVSTAYDAHGSPKQKASTSPDAKACAIIGGGTV